MFSRTLNPICRRDPTEKHNLPIMVEQGRAASSQVASIARTSDSHMSRRWLPCS